MSAALELIRAVKARGGQIRIDCGDIVIAPKEAAMPILEELRTHKAEILALLQPRADDPESWRAPFVEWIDANCVPFERASSGLVVLHRLYLAQAAQPCTRDVFRAMLAELCFPIREVGGTELVDGLILKDDLQAIMAEHGMKAEARNETNSRSRLLPSL
jgi:hypothetical protein